MAMCILGALQRANTIRDNLVMAIDSLKNSRNALRLLRLTELRSLHVVGITL
jgi:hypothetical protein